MQISPLLLEAAERFNKAADSVCIQWSLANGSSGISCPCDRKVFENLVRAKLNNPEPSEIAAEKIAA